MMTLKFRWWPGLISKNVTFLPGHHSFMRSDKFIRKYEVTIHVTKRAGGN